MKKARLTGAPFRRCSTGSHLEPSYRLRQSFGILREFKAAGRLHRITNRPRFNNEAKALTLSHQTSLLLLPWHIYIHGSTQEGGTIGFKKPPEGQRRRSSETSPDVDRHSSSSAVSGRLTRSQEGIRPYRPPVPKMLVPCKTKVRTTASDSYLSRIRRETEKAALPHSLPSGSGQSSASPSPPVDHSGGNGSSTLKGIWEATAAH